MAVETFDSWEGLMEAERRTREAADGRMRPWQEKLGPGAYFVRVVVEGIVIWGSILDPAKPIGDGPVSDEVLKEYEEEAKIYDEPHMRGFRFTFCSSDACPEGEYGDTHVSTVLSEVTKEEYELARELGWPSPMHPRLRSVYERALAHARDEENA